MRKILLLLACIMMATTSLFAEVKSIVLTPETFGVSGATTKQLKTVTQDGITVTYNGGENSNSFQMAGYALKTGQSNPAFLAVSENNNNYAITGVDVNVTKMVTSSMNTMYNYGIATSTTKPTIDTSSTNYLIPSEWTNQETGKFNSVTTNQHSTGSDKKYILVHNSGTMPINHFDKVTIYYDTEIILGDDNPGNDNPGDVTDQKTTTTLSFEKSKYEMTEGSKLKLNLITNLPDDAVINYYASPYGMTFEDDGTCVADRVGTYTVEASFDGNDKYTAKTATTTVEVTAAAGPVTPVENNYFLFNKSELKLNISSTRESLWDHITNDTSVPSFNDDFFSFTFSPLGSSPADGIEINEMGGLLPRKDGEYMVTASFAGNASYPAVTTQIKVIVGDGLSGGGNDDPNPASKPISLGSCNPANGTTVTELSIVTMDWKTSAGNVPDNYGPSFDDLNSRILPLLKNGTAIGTATVKRSYPNGYANDCIYILEMQNKDEWGEPAATTYTEAGTYSVTIPANFFSESQNQNLNGNVETTLSWTIEGGSTSGKITPTFAFKVKEISVALNTFVSLAAQLDKDNAIIPTNQIDFNNIKSVGNSPVGGVQIVYSSSVKGLKDGEYIVTAKWPGNDQYEAVEASIRVISGAGAPEGPARQAPEFAFNPLGYELYVGDTTSIAVETNLPDDAKITYTVSPTTGLTIDAKGNVTAEKKGTYTVKAAFDGDENYLEAEATTTVKVNVKPGETVDPVFEFMDAQVIVVNTETTHDMFKHLNKESEIERGDVEWSIRALDNAPLTDNLLLVGYLNPNTSIVGKYIVTATFKGRDIYNAKTTEVTVNIVDKEPVYGTALPSKTTPGQDAKLPSNTSISKITLTYPATAGEIEVIDRTEGVYLNLLKDGQVIQRIPTKDNHKAVSIDNNNYSQLNVVVDPIFAPGHYTLTLPVNLLTFGAGDSSTVAAGVSSTVADDLTDDEEFAKSHSAAFELNFDIIFSPDFTIKPAPGAVKQADLKHIEIVYAEGVTVGPANPPMAPGLHYRNDAAGFDENKQPIEPLTDFGKYTVTYEGNKVILDINCADLAPSPANSTVKYYYVSVPNGCWIATYDGTEYPFVGQNIGNYSVIDETIGEVKGSPWLSIDENSSVTFDEIKTIKLYYPESYSFNNWSASNPLGKKIGNAAIANLRKVADATQSEGTEVANYMLTGIDEANRTLTFTLLDAQNVTAETGMHCIKLTSSTLIGANKQGNTNIYFKGIDITTVPERKDVGFFISDDEELEFDANAPHVDTEETQTNDDRTPTGYLTLNHHEDFGNGFHLSVAKAAMHLDHVSDFSGGIYETPRVKMVATSTPGQTKVGLVTSSAGNYNLSFNMPNSLFFNACKHEVKVKIRPNANSLGLTLAGREIYEEAVDYYVVDYTGSELSYENESATNAQFGFSNFSGYDKDMVAKVWYKVIDPNVPANAPKRAAAVSIEGYTLAGTTPLNLNEVGLKKQKLSLILEQNGVLSKPIQVNLNVSSTIPTGINEIRDAANGVKYLDLQGREVANPANGLFIRIENGKAEKVMLK